MYKLFASFFICIVYCLPLSAQTIDVYPTHWWAGMKNPDLQLMIHSPDIADRIPVIKISEAGMQLSAGITLKKIERVENSNYIFFDLVIDKDAEPGKRVFSFGEGKKKVSINYELKERRQGNGTAYAQGVTSSDFIYLLMPDRFSNGDTTNDRIAGMKDQSLNRDSIFLRHGGDLQGVINHLDYLKDMGITTLWMTPVIENDMPDRTEHGYAFTNHYKIEPRIGGEKAYLQLSDELHKRGMKLIQDAVYNHVGLYDFFVQDMPSKDWLHQWPQFTQTSYREQPLFDPHAAESDKKRSSDGWFTQQMPDLNQSNPLVANFLIQHAIYSVEEFGVDGWRIDTYIYNDLEFMNSCNKALTDEYPHITMFGEAWVHGAANEAYFAENNISTPFKSNLQGITDFQCLFYGIQPAMNEAFGWTDGVNKLYTTLSNDFLYKDPTRNVIFLDNHDLGRWYSVVNENLQKDKTGFVWLLTCRGIPQMYYGDEVLMKGVTNPDGWVRLDFPGGWNGDSANAFTGKNLNADQLSVQSLIKTLANFRKNSSALKTGKLMQYLPVDGLYVYFRYDENQTIMIVLNTSDKQQTVDFSKYAERTSGFTNAVNVFDNTTNVTSAPITLEANTSLVLELKK
ncbi:alpha-amylase family glycosyl hydrolase [Parafilimonas sp.]|uniref:alpha-amylase family glycosyl hydrolase n=1 Tax=Parafilimonas sp. TaxID=1969739 RepID=UPI0039E50568